MNYNSSYNYCALVVFAIIFADLIIKKNIHDKRNKMFIALVVCCCFSAVFDIIDAYLMNNIESYPLWVIQVANYAFYFAQNTVPLLFAMYIFVFIDSVSLFTKPLVGFAVFLPILFVYTALCLNGLTGWIFKFNSGLSYENGYMLYALYGISCYYLLMFYYIVFRNRKSLKKQTKISFTLFIPVILTTVLYQIMNNDQPVINFGLAVCMLIMLIAIENRDEVWDGEMNMANRSALIDVVRLATAQKQKFTVVLLVMTNLKNLKNVYGIKFVNEMTKDNCEKLKKLLRRKERIFSVSEGELAMITAYGTESELYDRTNEFLNYFRKGIKYSENLVRVEMQACIIRCPDDAQNEDDVAEYFNACSECVSKQEIIFADNLDKNSIKRRCLVETAIKNAIDNDGVEVVYQPIYSLKDEKYVSAEALARIRDDNLGKIMPTEFIPIAEHCGLVLKLGEIVLNKVCDFVSREKLYEKDFNCVQINLSPIQCMQDNLSKQILSIINKYKIPHEFICFEVTESTVVNSRRVFLKNMKKLQDEGIQFALDDYGTGYSNMDSVVSYPFNFIKIDKSLVDNVGKLIDSTIAIEGIVSLISKLSKEVIIEGIENDCQANFLGAISCNLMQGYYFSKPVKENVLTRKIESGTIAKTKTVEL